MQDRPIPEVPPNSTALRELAHAIDQTLTLPAPAERRISHLLATSQPGQEYSAWLRILRERSRLARQAMRRLLAERDTDDQGVMTMVAVLRKKAAQLPGSSCDHESEPTP